MTLPKTEPVGVTKAALSVQETAYALGISAKAVRKLVTTGTLPTVPHLGARTYRIPARAVEAFANGESEVA